jgi:hypothetical protein
MSNVYHEHTHTKEDNVQHKRQEHRVYLALVNAGYTHCKQLGDAIPPPMSFVRERMVDFRREGEVDNGRTYIDFVINPGGGGGDGGSEDRTPLVFLEVDESQHRYGYGEARCDMKRMSKVMESLALTSFCGNVLWLRYNPDNFQVDGVTQGARTMPMYTKKRREKWLIRRLRAIGRELPLKRFITIEYAYYDVDTTKTATKPIVVHSDVGYNRVFAECATIAPGCMPAATESLKLMKE